jgi:hypothetical protein
MALSHQWTSCNISAEAGPLPERLLPLRAQYLPGALRDSIPWKH